MTKPSFSFLAIPLLVGMAFLPEAAAQTTGEPAMPPEPALGDVHGTTMMEIMTSLHEAGYDVWELDRDSDEIDADILFDGRWLELEISIQSGEIVDIYEDE